MKVNQSKGTIFVLTNATNRKSLNTIADIFRRILPGKKLDTICVTAKKGKNIETVKLMSPTEAVIFDPHNVSKEQAKHYSNALAALRPKPKIITIGMVIENAEHASNWESVPACL